ncbi:hypothetical protein [Enterobacter hormaechei]|uniref:hypothetical protein n=1 Tax=Enterobacter hormaechei TaxID=158836 RepID=UPI0015C56B3D|nr:hypothetical protein [Enterobacter hormaechei]NQD84876.1 hypothetical protein [Enterobacter hormaechei]
MLKKIFVAIIFLLTLAFIITPSYLYWDTFHEYGISSKNQDWSNFGSFFGGFYSAAFGLISILILCATLYLTLDYNKKQLTQLKSDSIKNLLVHHINSLNEKMNNRKNIFYSPANQRDLHLSENQYIDSLQNRFKINIAIDQQNIPNWRFNPIKTTLEVMTDTKISYPEELTVILNILGIINRIKDEELRNEAINLFSSLTYRNRTYWLISYAYFNNDEAKKCIVKYPKLWALADGLKP